jgi:hypothetical protein
MSQPVPQENIAMRFTFQVDALVNPEEMGTFRRNNPAATSSGELSQNPVIAYFLGIAKAREMIRLMNPFVHVKVEILSNLDFGDNLVTSNKAEDLQRLINFIHRG